MEQKAKKTVMRFIVALMTLSAVQTGQAQVISGTIDDWDESGQLIAIGDGDHHVTLWWSINTFNMGWFYGSSFTGDSDVAHAPGVTDISQITDASQYSFTSGSIGPICDSACTGVGEFVVWRNVATGHYGALRVDEINVIDLSIPLATLSGTWWFQTNGTADFSDGDVPGDLTGDGFVGVADLLILLGEWGPCADCDDCPADLDGDCMVGVSDLLILLSNWG